MDPFLYGGEMIRDVSLRDAPWNGLPWKFEAGTPPIAEGIRSRQRSSTSKTSG